MNQPSATPPKLPFELQVNEHVLLHCRRHWVFLTIGMVKVALVGLLPIVALLLLASFTFGLDGRGGQVVGLICLVWFVFWAIKGYFALYRYNNDIWIVTDQRVIDSTKTNWFNHRMASADLEDVQDISTNRSGLFGTAFDYGNLLLQTAGERENFILSGIPKPAEVLTLIDVHRDAAKRELRNPGL